MTGFEYDGGSRRMVFAPRAGTWFWSNGYAWGTCDQDHSSAGARVRLAVAGGMLHVAEFRLRDGRTQTWEPALALSAGASVSFAI